MMTKQQYIDYWINTAENDWTTVRALFDTKRYLHCLFWSHLVLEKLAKAHWVRNHEAHIPPKVHNIVWLLKDSQIDLGNEIMHFLSKLNDFQLSTRYPDYMNDVYKIATKEYTENALNIIKEIRQCLLKMLQ